ncbi:hypothetical protein Bbelb_283570 [Branchiostoma belcheri]|nr:hypothetical protein Bbelb_283570 [Branchiostoma belcheri]
MAENEVRQFITNDKMTTSRNTHQQIKISEAAKTIRMDRTTIPIDLLKKYPRDAQTHCERIADFLLPGHAVHWHKEEGQIVFHDSPNDQPNPLLLANIRFPNQPSCYQHEDMVTGYLINSTCPGTQKYIDTYTLLNNLKRRLDDDRRSSTRLQTQKL